MKKKMYVTPALEVISLMTNKMIASSPTGGFDSGEESNSPELAPGQRPADGDWGNMWN